MKKWKHQWPTDGLVERLRGRAKEPWTSDSPDILDEAAAEIERLRAKIEEMAKCCDAQEHGQIGCRCAGYNVSPLGEKSVKNDDVDLPTHEDVKGILKGAPRHEEI